jgi:DNA-binding PadR family transcriptional regulator
VDHQIVPEFQVAEHHAPASEVESKSRMYDWWFEDTQQTLYPNLSKMALDLLSIPVMSTEPE